MEKLNWFCVECKSLGKGCKGSTNPVYSGCVYRKHWLDRGNKVKVIATGKIGVIQCWDYVTNSHYVRFDDGRVFLYYQKELQEVIDA